MRLSVGLVLLLFALSASAARLTQAEINAAIHWLNSSQRANCPREFPRQCSRTLNDLVRNDEKGYFIGAITNITPWSACHQNALAESPSTAKDMIDVYEQSEDLRLGPLHKGFVERCLTSDSPLTAVQKKSLASKYYYLINRIEAGQVAALTEIAAIDAILNEPAMGGVDCDRFDTPETVAQCHAGKSCRFPVDSQKEFYQAQAKNLKRYAELKAAEKEIDQNIRHVPATTPREFPELRIEYNRRRDQLNNALKALQAQIELFEKQNPWFKSKHLAELVKNPNDGEVAAKLKKGIRAHLTETRAELAQKAQRWQVLSECISGRRSCGVGFVQKELEKVPPYSYSFNYQSEGDRRSGVLGLDQAMCLADMVESRREANSAMTKASGIAVLSGAGLLGAAAAGGRMVALARAGNLGVDMAWFGQSVGGAVHACLSKEFNVSSGQKSCGPGMLKQLSQFAEQDGCLGEVAYAAIDAIPFLPHATKLKWLAATGKTTAGPRELAYRAEVALPNGQRVERRKIDAAVAAKAREETQPARYDPGVIADLKLDDVRKRELQAKLDELSSYGAEGIRRANRVLDYISKTHKNPEQAVDNFLNNTFPKFSHELQDLRAGVVRVRTRPFARPPTPTRDLRLGMSMSEVEQKFDIIARKASEPKTPDIVHEVDTAFSSRGIPDRVVRVDSEGTVVAHGSHGEKAFAIGHRGALGYTGKLSNQGGERFYAVLYPKGFIEHYGADLRATTSHGRSGDIPPVEQFREKIAADGRVFVIRAESSTAATGGQVHFQHALTHGKIEIDGETTSQIEWMRKNALGVVEYDGAGNVVQFRLFDQ